MSLFTKVSFNFPCPIFVKLEYMYRVENKDHREPYLILLSNKYIFIYGIYGPIIPNTRLNYKHDLIHKHHHTYKHTHTYTFKHTFTYIHRENNKREESKYSRGEMKIGSRPKRY